MDETVNPPLGFVLVTGGGVRLGAEVCRHLAAAGFGVIIHYNQSGSAATALSSEIKAAGGRAATLQVDLSTQPDWSAVLAPIHQAYPIIGIVNNASIFDDDCFETHARAEIERHVSINFYEPLALCQWLKLNLPSEKSGFIINVLDQKVYNTNTDYFSYTMSKLAFANATLTLALAMAPNVRVNSVSPGLLLPSGPQSDENFAKVHNKTPLGRGANPGDVAQAIVFLARAGAITGVDIPVDGGQRLVKSRRDVMFT